MTEMDAKRELEEMLRSFTPGSVLHLLGEILRESERSRVGELDQVAQERMVFAEGFLLVAGIGLDSVCPR